MLTTAGLTPLNNKNVTFSFGFASLSGSNGMVDRSLAGFDWGSSLTVCTWFWLVRTGQAFSLVSNGAAHILLPPP